jgi:hypothetical protein
MIVPGAQERVDRFGSLDAARPGRWGRFARGRIDQLQRIVQSGRRRSAGERPQPMSFTGKWQKERSENLEPFLQTMGVGYLMRQIAVRASQQQKLSHDNGVVQLEISDRRGKSNYRIHPDSLQRRATGFMKLPIEQRAAWESDGTLFVEERYQQHLGGPEHGKPCEPEACPVVRSRRSVDHESGEMIVQVERTLRSGEGMTMRSFFKRVEP